jgi:subtilisin family serine protease
MSLGSLSPFNDGYGTEETIVNRLTSLTNTLFIISAGNSGPGRQTVGSPSVARKAISVAATANRAMIERQYEWPGIGANTSGATDDFVLYFSSRGPTAAGGFAPSLSAPGTELSSVQLNTAPGGHAGLDVYWGTSMAAPTVTGAYALFLDAIRKYNIKHADKKLPTDAETLRSVLISSGRKFGTDQYSWIDEGTGMIDLTAAWTKLLKTRDDNLSTGVADAKGNPINLDYQVVTSQVMANGAAYDGSRMESNDGQTPIPAFGSGLYFDSRDGTQMKKAFISRQLRETEASAENAGDLTVQLVTSAEEFTLRSDFGRDEAWATPGALSEVDCEGATTHNV